jgi:hypothetical protein
LQFFSARGAQMHLQSQQFQLLFAVHWLHRFTIQLQPHGTILLQHQLTA